MTGLEIVVAAMLFVGLVGVVIPILPGVLLVWAGVMVWAIWGEGDDAVRWLVAGGATVVTAVALVLAATLPGRRAATFGAPRSLTWVVALGTLVGAVAIPVVGALVGGPVAAFVAELVRLRDVGAARRSSIEALKGFGIGIGIQLVAAVAIAGAWTVAVIAG